MRARRGGADLIDPGAMLARRGRDPSPEALRFGVELADGRRATNLGRLPHGGEDSPEIALVPRSGGGGGRSYDQTYWLWPLPPPGKLTVAVEWPGREIPLTTHELDAAPILEAAARSLPLWEDDGPGPTSGGWARYAP